MRQALDIAVIGGGINGVSVAAELAAAGHRVELFERGSLMGETSSRSSKLLHGGLRYLETGSFRLVRESLRERARWLQDCPQHAQALRIALPVYAGVSRSPAAEGSRSARTAVSSSPVARARDRSASTTSTRTGASPRSVPTAPAAPRATPSATVWSPETRSWRRAGGRFPPASTETA